MQTKYTVNLKEMFQMNPDSGAKRKVAAWWDDDGSQKFDLQQILDGKGDRPDGSTGSQPRNDTRIPQTPPQPWKDPQPKAPPTLPDGANGEKHSQSSKESVDWFDWQRKQEAEPGHQPGLPKATAPSEERKDHRDSNQQVVPNSRRLPFFCPRREGRLVIPCLEWIDRSEQGGCLTIARSKTWGSQPSGA